MSTYKNLFARGIITCSVTLFAADHDTQNIKPVQLALPSYQQERSTSPLPSPLSSGARYRVAVATADEQEQQPLVSTIKCPSRCCQGCIACCAALRRAPFKLEREKKMLAHTKSMHLRRTDAYTSADMRHFKGIRFIAWASLKCPSLLNCMSYLCCCNCFPCCRPDMRKRSNPPQQEMTARQSTVVQPNPLLATPPSTGHQGHPLVHDPIPDDFLPGYVSDGQ